MQKYFFLRIFPEKTLFHKRRNFNRSFGETLRLAQETFLFPHQLDFFYLHRNTPQTLCRKTIDVWIKVERNIRDGFMRQGCSSHFLRPCCFVGRERTSLIIFSAQHCLIRGNNSVWKHGYREQNTEISWRKDRGMIKSDLNTVARLLITHHLRP